MGFITNFAVLATALVPTLVLAAPPSIPTISKLTFSGPGCTQGSNLKWSGNLDELTVRYSEFAARNPGDGTSNCQIHIQTTGGTAGWQYALKSTELKGSASLDAGATLTVFTSVYFSEDASNTATVSSSLANTEKKTIGGDVRVFSDFSSKPIWSACNSDGGTGLFHVNTRGALTDAKSTFNANTQTWELKWRRC
ncbi:hypothetical protein B0T18DRAFT_317207 [Schizothecium vesticola]|uniref:Secreted protein n=1 Tax=Schizothecium vesticola TaxID=314040 RepID=A0AA40KAQ8_9PEZI|nr:hypothetical protein B0T18DRAFT_317207 [Schizothecium vesticola]